MKNKSILSILVIALLSCSSLGPKPEIQDTPPEKIIQGWVDQNTLRITVTSYPIKTKQSETAQINEAKKMAVQLAKQIMLEQIFLLRQKGQIMLGFEIERHVIEYRFANEINNARLLEMDCQKISGKIGCTATFEFSGENLKKRMYFPDLY